MALWFTVEADWNQDGVWEQVVEPISAAIERGRFSEQQPYLVGQATILVNDDDDLYHPRNTNSALYGQVLPGRRMRVVAHDGVNDYPLFSGFLAQVLPQKERRVKFIARDRLAQLKETTVTSGMVINQKTGAVVQAYLDDAGVPATEYSVEPGLTTITRAYLSRRFGEAMADVAAAEFGRIYVDGNGVVVFEDRVVRFRKSTPEMTLDDSVILGISPPTGWEWVRNRVDVVSHPVNIDATAVTLWQTSQRIEIKAGQTAEIWATFTDPSTNQRVGGESVTLIWDANTAPDGSGTDISADVDVQMTTLGDSAKLVITNNAADMAYIAATITGNPVVQEERRWRVENNTSQAKYGRKDLEIDSKLIQSDTLARNMALFILGQRKDPADPATITVDLRMAPQVLSAEISTRVRVVSNRHYIDQEYFVEGLRFQLEAGRVWQAMLYLEPTGMTGDYFVWGYSLWGVSTRFAF